MTLTLSLSTPTSIDIPEGGTLRWTGDGAVPGTLGRTTTGGILGPLEFGVPPGTTLETDHIEFSPEDDDGTLSLPLLSTSAVTAGAAGAAVAAPTIDDEASTEVTRRGMLGLLTAVGIGLATTGAAAQSDEQVTLSIATVDVTDVNGPFSVRVLDIVDAALPPTTDILIDHSGSRVGRVASADERVDMQAEPGTVRLYVRDSVSNLTRLLAWVSSFTNWDDSISYSRTFPNGQQASDYEEETFVRLTSHPMIVGAIDEAGVDATRFIINNTTIPHIDDGASEAGAWDILGDPGELIYEAGPNPPAETEWTIKTYLSFTQQLRQ